MIPPSEILIVDDVSENIKVAINILKHDNFNFSFALSGEQAIEILKKKRFDLILLDVMMPGIDGFTVCKMIKKTPQLKDTPIIFVTAKVDIDSIEHGFNIGAVDYVTKPFHPVELKVRVHNHLELHHARKSLKKHNISLNNKIVENESKHFTELELAQKEVIYILSELLESGSVETANHVKRVANISKLLATNDQRLSDEDVKTIFLASPLHDIGKILIDDKILHKPGKLTDEEFVVMKEHAQYAFNVLKRSERKLIKAGSIIAHQHHENYDGSGYPRGLKGEEIHLYGRIVAIADVLDALTHKRVYKKAWSFEEAKAFVIENRGKKFDPILVDIFQKHSKEFEALLV